MAKRKIAKKKKSKITASKNKVAKTFSLDEELVSDISSMIEESQNNIVSQVNNEMVKLYWQIGTRIHQELLKDKKADYGKQVIDKLSQKLQAMYGKGFGKSNLFYMLEFSRMYSNDKIFQTVSGKLSWSHFVVLITIKDSLKRDFYLEMSSYEGWSVRTLKDRIRSMLFERTAISGKPEKLIRQELDMLRKKKQINPKLVFRDPYIFDFLCLEDSYSELDLENAILHKLGKFLVELGSDFAFLGRQKRITIDQTDFYMDLLFYHRGLRSLVVVELKLGKFLPEYKGQMELYLRYLEKYEVREGENLPVGLILCAEKSKEVVELLKLDEDRINIAEYWTKLPTKGLLEQSLQRAIKEAKNEFETIGKDDKNKKLKNIEALAPKKQEIENLHQLLQKSKKLTPQQARQKLKLNQKELRKQVRQGQRQGWLKIIGRGKATCYHNCR